MRGGYRKIPDAKRADLWAGGYGKGVSISDEADACPFAGYRRVQGAVYRAVLRHGTASGVLDAGFGTAVLSGRLYDRGFAICGVDFSARMVRLARERMPLAVYLFQYDFTASLPAPLRERRFDCIVSTYALHHMDEAGQFEMVRQPHDLLRPGGLLRIGDVAFAERTALARCRMGCGDEWDDEEPYFVFDELRDRLGLAAEFTALSDCAGLSSIERAWRQRVS